MIEVEKRHQEKENYTNESLFHYFSFFYFPNMFWKSMTSPNQNIIGSNKTIEIDQSMQTKFFICEKKKCKIRPFKFRPTKMWTNLSLVYFVHVPCEQGLIIHKPLYISFFFLTYLFSNTSPNNIIVIIVLICLLFCLCMLLQFAYIK